MMGILYVKVLSSKIKDFLKDVCVNLKGFVSNSVFSNLLCLPMFFIIHVPLFIKKMTSLEVMQIFNNHSHFHL